jgi:hypothetical protein
MKIFDISKGTVVINENVLTIPFLSKLVERFPDSKLKVLSYIHFSTFIDSDNPYGNMDESTRQARLKRDFPTVPHDDPDIKVAIGRIEEMYETPADRLRAATQNSVDILAKNMITMANNAVLGDVKDFKGAVDVIRTAGDMAEALKQVTETAKTQKSNIKIAYDQRKRSKTD